MSELVLIKHNKEYRVERKSDIPYISSVTVPEEQIPIILAIRSGDPCGTFYITEEGSTPVDDTHARYVFKSIMLSIL